MVRSGPQGRVSNHEAKVHPTWTPAMHAKQQGVSPNASPQLRSPSFGWYRASISAHRSKPTIDL